MRRLVLALPFPFLLLLPRPTLLQEAKLTPAALEASIGSSPDHDASPLPE